MKNIAVIGAERFFLRALTGSDIGIGESFMEPWSDELGTPRAASVRECAA